MQVHLGKRGRRYFREGGMKAGTKGGGENGDERIKEKESLEEGRSETE